jgi:branched-chain amino acid transport system ATP-binding protein
MNGEHNHGVILETHNLAKAFGNVKAVTSVTMDVQEGEILGILGPNGSGKTTLFNLLTGVHMPDAGHVLFNGRDVTRATPFQRSRDGIGRTYQIPRPFGNMTVLENLMVAAAYGGRMSEKACRPKMDDILKTTGLASRRHAFARELPLLDRKRLEVARAMATHPSLLLLDEVAGGLTESEAGELLTIVKQLQDQGVTVVWIEHILMMMEDVDRILVLDQGCNLMCGNPEEVMSSQEVLECYLGKEEKC